MAKTDIRDDVHPTPESAHPRTFRQRASYSQAFKMEVVRMALRLPPSARIKPTCRAYPGIEPVQIRKWIRNFGPIVEQETAENYQPAPSSPCPRLTIPHEEINYRQLALAAHTLPAQHSPTSPGFGHGAAGAADSPQASPTWIRALAKPSVMYAQPMRHQAMSSPVIFEAERLDVQDPCHWQPPAQFLTRPPIHMHPSSSPPSPYYHVSGTLSPSFGAPSVAGHISPHFVRPPPSGYPHRASSLTPPQLHPNSPLASPRGMISSPLSGPVHIPSPLTAASLSALPLAASPLTSSTLAASPLVAPLSHISSPLAESVPPALPAAMYAPVRLSAHSLPVAVGSSLGGDGALSEQATRQASDVDMAPDPRELTSSDEAERDETDREASQCEQSSGNAPGALTDKARAAEELLFLSRGNFE